MAGTTSQPSMGAVAASLVGTPLDTGLDMEEVTMVNDYWEECRGLYAPFESGQKSGSADVYNHEMPGTSSVWEFDYNGVFVEQFVLYRFSYILGALASRGIVHRETQGMVSGCPLPMRNFRVGSFSKFLFHVICKD